MYDTYLLTYLLSRELTDFDQIWYTDKNVHPEHGNLTKRSKFFKFKMADGPHIENRFFANISAPYWPIYANFGMEMKNHRQITVTWLGNFRKFKMADGRHFENSFISISPPRIIRFRSNLVRLCKFPFRGWVFDKKVEIFQIQDGGRTPYWKSFFG